MLARSPSKNPLVDHGSLRLLTHGPHRRDQVLRIDVGEVATGRGRKLARGPVSSHEASHVADEPFGVLVFDPPLDLHAYREHGSISIHLEDHDPSSHNPGD